MKAIDFVARRGMGVVERGTVAADAAETVVAMDAGVEFSLNLQPGDMQAYSRQGNNLEIVLADGRVIVLDGYFVGGGENPNRLFISTGGTLNEVSFIEGADGALFAQYGTTAEWGKWSPDSDLIFVDDPNLMAATGIDGDQDVSMLGAGLLGAGLLGGGGAGAGALAAGAAGAALLAAGGGAATTPTQVGTPVTQTPTPTPPTPGTPGNPGSPPARALPTVEGTGRTDTYGGDNLQAAQKTITVNGTAEAGSSVTISVGGQTKTVVTGADGKWSGTFDGANFPADGSYTANVTVVDTDGRSTNLTGQSVVIDTTPPVIDPTDGTISSGDKINAAEHSTGTIKIAGKGEAGSTIDVTVDGKTHSTTVDANGQWSVNFSNTEIAGGERTTPVVIKTTDSYGNSHTQTESMVIDTVAPNIVATAGTGSASYVVNAADLSADGNATVSGTGEAGATYVIKLGNAGGATRTGTIDANGKWSADFTQAELGGLSGVNGYTVPFTMTATDGFGNPSTAVSDTIKVDTLADVGMSTNVSGGNDHVANHAETGNGAKNLVLTGTSEPGTTSVKVTMNGFTRNATVNATTGEWSVNFEPGTYATGTNTYQASAVSTDAAGNTANATMNVRVDTEVTNLNVSNRPALGNDSYLGLDDAEGGVTLTGNMETNWTDVPGTPGVVVRFNGVDYTATVNGTTGTWSVDIPEGGIPANYEGKLVYSVTGTDSVGNVQTISRSIDIDTEVPDGSDVIGYSANFNNGSLEYYDFDVEKPSDTLGVARVEANGTVNVLTPDANGVTGDYGTAAVRGKADQLRISLSDEMSNGQNLIITETDAAGNSSGSYIVLDGGPATTTMSNANLGAHEIETIDLRVTDTSLTLTEADIKALSSNSDTVKIRGEAKTAIEADSGDAVSLVGATANGTTVEDGVTYNVYSLGTATVYIEDEITNVTI